MIKTLKFNGAYFGLMLLLFGIEILIAKFAHDPIIRPYFGDFLVVILIYCFVKSFLNTPYLFTAIAVLAFSFSLEIMQYFNLVKLLGLENHPLARIAIGTSFEWIDLIAYCVGIAMVIFVERSLSKRKLSTEIKVESNFRNG